MGVQDRLRALFRPAPQEPVATMGTLTDPQAVVRLLESATTAQAGLTVLARVVGLSGYDRPEPEWSARLRETWRQSEHTGPMHDALVAWALETAEPWGRAYRTEAPGSEGRRAAPRSPHLLPSLLVLSFSRHNLGRVGAAPRADAAAAAAIWSSMGRDMPVAAYEAWERWGFLDADAIDRHRALSSHDDSRESWARVLAHPNTSAEAKARAVRQLISGVRDATVLDAPDVLQHRAVRDACVEQGRAEGPLLRLLIEHMPPDEFQPLVTSLSHLGYFARLGAAFRYATPEQRATVRVSGDEFARWCTRVPPSDRSLIMGLAGAVVDEPKPTAPVR